MRVFVVWEPILWTDLAPPVNAVLRRVTDPRAAQFWDKTARLGRELARSPWVNRDVPTWGGDGKSEPIVWDYAAVFPPGALWEARLPEPSFQDGPVVHAIDGIRKALDEARRIP